MEHFCENLEGWFNYPNLYSELVKNIPNGGTFVEVGVWKGKSLSYFVVESINNNKTFNICAVDTWEGSPEHRNDSCVINNTLFDEFLKNIKPINDKVLVYRMTSAKASTLFEDNSIDGIFIDAAHNYEDVKQDLQLWYPKVKSGGFFCGHDYHPAWGGVIAAVDEFFANKEEKIIASETCWITRKT